MTPYIKELHTRYYEPLSEVMPLEELLAGPEVKKLLFMTEPCEIDDVVKPHMERLMAESSADTTQAVDSMLEIVPRGVCSLPVYTCTRPDGALLAVHAVDGAAHGCGMQG